MVFRVFARRRAGCWVRFPPRKLPVRACAGPLCGGHHRGDPCRRRAQRVVGRASCARCGGNINSDVEQFRAWLCRRPGRGPGNRFQLPIPRCLFSIPEPRYPNSPRDCACTGRLRLHISGQSISERSFRHFRLVAGNGPCLLRLFCLPGSFLQVIDYAT